LRLRVSLLTTMRRDTVQSRLSINFHASLSRHIPAVLISDCERLYQSAAGSFVVHVRLPQRGRMRKRDKRLSCSTSMYISMLVFHPRRPRLDELVRKLCVRRSSISTAGCCCGGRCGGTSLCSTSLRAGGIVVVETSRLYQLIWDTG